MSLLFHDPVGDSVQFTKPRAGMRIKLQNSILADPNFLRTGCNIWYYQIRFSEIAFDCRSELSRSSLYCGKIKWFSTKLIHINIYVEGGCRG
jgi:hypothetical protein